jgi:hypothetical protein
MNLRLFRQLLELNQAFEGVVSGIARMEKQKLFQGAQLRLARAEIETTRVSVNREFFDNFKAIVENDSRWAYRLLRKHERKTQDRFDLYLEIKQREDARMKKGLAPRVTFLPGWDQDDEPLIHRKRTAKKQTTRQSDAAKRGARRTGR